MKTTLVKFYKSDFAGRAMVDLTKFLNDYCEACEDFYINNKNTIEVEMDDDTYTQVMEGIANYGDVNVIPYSEKLMRGNDLVFNNWVNDNILKYGSSELKSAYIYAKVDDDSVKVFTFKLTELVEKKILTLKECKRFLDLNCWDDDDFLEYIWKKKKIA